MSNLGMLLLLFIVYLDVLDGHLRRADEDLLTGRALSRQSLEPIVCHSDCHLKKLGPT